MAQHPFDVPDIDFPQFKATENFFVRMYDKKGQPSTVDEARKYLFTCRTVRSLDRLPPTQVRPSSALRVAKLIRLTDLIIQTIPQPILGHSSSLLFFRMLSTSTPNDVYYKVATG